VTSSPKDPIKEKGGVNLYAMVDNGVVNVWDNLGYGEFIVKERDNIDTNSPGMSQGALTVPPEGFQVEYTPDENACPCGTITLLQVIVREGYVKDDMAKSDASTKDWKKNSNTPGGIKMPAMTTQDSNYTGGTYGYVDSPTKSGWQGGFRVTVIAVCRSKSAKINDVILDKATFTFDLNKRKIRKALVKNSSVGEEDWKTAKEYWNKNGGPKS
jgi:hypothetical protein